MDFAILGVLPRLVAGFRRDHPDVEVDLRYSWTARQRAELLGGEVDLGFLIGPFSADGVRTRTVVRQRYVAVLPDAHPLAAPLGAARGSGARPVRVRRGAGVGAVARRGGPVVQ